MTPLNVGLMGLGRGGQLLLEALTASSWCRVVAVGSIHPERIERFREQHPGIATHGDFRSLIVSSALDALFVAVPPYLRVSFLNLAAERSLPVYMLAPAGRNVEEALALAAKFEAAGVPLVVSRCWGNEAALQPEALALEQAGRLFLTRGVINASLDGPLDWRGDSQRSGGGVLLHEAYGLVDTLVQAAGLPGTVYAATSVASRNGSAMAYDTEDTAVLACRYTSGALATVTASWGAGPRIWSLDVQGTNRTLRITTQRVSVLDPSGAELHGAKRPANPLAAQVEEFLGGLAAARRQFAGAIMQHLPTMAMLQAAYLSARTGQPENPGTILDVHQSGATSRKRR